MSELDPKELRRELLLEQGINAQLDRLVGYATQTALLLPNSRMKTSQLRNLLNVSLDSGSVEVTVNFIRYQIAREGNAWGTAKDSFGHTVIADIRERIAQLTQAALDKAKELERRNPGDVLLDFTDKQAEVYVRLVQLYLGYLQRVFYAYDKAQDKRSAFEQMNEIVKAALSKQREATHAG
jgi:hypothetical protein